MGTRGDPGAHSCHLGDEARKREMGCRWHPLTCTRQPPPWSHLVRVARMTSASQLEATALKARGAGWKRGWLQPVKGKQKYLLSCKDKLTRSILPHKGGRHWPGVGVPSRPASGLTAEGGWGQAGKSTEGSAILNSQCAPTFLMEPQKGALPSSPPCRCFTPPGHPES